MENLSEKKRKLRPISYQKREEYAEGIELVCGNWAALEWLLAVALWSCLKTPYPYCLEITNDLDITKRIKLLNKVSDVIFKNEKEDIKNIQSKIEEMASDRNLLVHGRRYFYEDGNWGFLIDRGKYRGTVTLRTPKDVVDLGCKICDAANELATILHKYHLLESDAANFAMFFDGKLTASDLF